METPRTVVITGGTKGIGAAIAKAFVATGAHVLLGARSDNGLAQSLGPLARFHGIDVAHPAEHRALVQKAMDWTGRLDVFVNNAGLSEWRPIGEADEAFWRQMLDTNLTSVFFGCQAAAEHLKRGGCIINVSSMAGKRGTANNSAYCAAKFGVNGITQSLAKELGPRGIRVNAVCPVLVRTDGLVEALSDKRAPSGGDVDAFLKQFTAANSALGVLPTAEEVAAVCTFLASPAASAITGQCLNVDCGVFPQ
jgi:NAD(P)-dependent dehydrogenase (short-subunit alcohol dehydrogenase family)